GRAGTRTVRGLGCGLRPGGTGPAPPAVQTRGRMPPHLLDDLLVRRAARGGEHEAGTGIGGTVVLQEHGVVQTEDLLTRGAHRAAQGLPGEHESLVVLVELVSGV